MATSRAIKRTGMQKIKQLVAISASGSVAFAAVCWYKQEPRFHSNIIMPIMHKLVDPETAHDLAVSALARRVVPKDTSPNPECLKTTKFGLTFKHPVGIAAGFDKDAKAIRGLDDIGFSFVEVGSVTPEPQPGNDKPRVFRLAEDQGVINRYGFNSEGHLKVLERVKAFREDKGQNILLGVNLGKNKTSEDAAKDYVQGVEKFGPYADYLVINISSPNTPGLRDLQGKKELSNLVSKVLEARDKLARKVPVLLKVAPDLTEQDKKDICDVVTKGQTKVDGLIVSNTTISRPDSLQSDNKAEKGGLSGKPLRGVSTKAIGDFYKLTEGQIPIVGVGGVATGADALEKIKAGASLVQVYSAMVYQGFPIAKTIKKELGQELEQMGIINLDEVVGVNNKK